MADRVDLQGYNERDMRIYKHKACMRRCNHRALCCCLKVVYNTNILVFGGKLHLIEVHSNRIAEYLNSNSNNRR